MIPNGFLTASQPDPHAAGIRFGRMKKTQYRAVWISDIHLGSKACRIEPLLEFISSLECETLYLVGDIIDLWSLQRKWHWPQSHNDFIRKVLKRASKGEIGRAHV